MDIMEGDLQDRIDHTMALALVEELCRKNQLDPSAFDYIYRKNKAKVLVRIDSNVIKYMLNQTEELQDNSE